MKKILSVALIGSLLLSILNYKSFAQNANTDLSNLTSPTKVNVNLLPKSDNTKDFGSVKKSWKDVYIDGLFYREGNPWLGGIYYSDNTFIGNSAGYSNLASQSTNQDNTFVGASAGYSTTTGTANTFVGSYAGRYNINGGSNVFIGQQTGRDNISGSNNVFLGIQAGTRNTSGAHNVFIGEVAGGFNKTGSENTFVGNLAGYYNASSLYNVSIGSYSGYNATGAQNTFIGTSAGRDFTVGNYNTCLGINSGYAGTSKTGNYNTYIGGYSNAASSVINATALGYLAYVGSSYTVRIGDPTITSIGGYANWSNISDGRVKKNIKQNVPGLTFINKLQPVTYNLDLDAADRIIQRPAIKDKEGKTIQPLQEEITARQDKEKIIYSGFVAQDVEKIAKELNYDFSGVDAAKNEKDLYGLRYAEFVVPLVKAVQELSVKNNELKNDYEGKISDLQKQIDKLKSMILSGNHSSISQQLQTRNEKQEMVKLEQNIPNPFNHTTTINYTLTQSFLSAQIIITDKNGKTIKQVNISGSGNGAITIDADMFSSGAYQYSLMVDGKMIGSKQMILEK